MDKKNIIKNSNIYSENDSEIDISKIINIIFRNKNFISSITIFGTFAGIIFSLLQQPIYRGTFQIVVENKEGIKSNKSPSVSNLLITGGLSSTNKTQELILKSPLVLNSVYRSALKEYNLRNDYRKKWSFNVWSAKTLDINFANGSNVLNISFLDSDKKFIIKTLNEISSKYQNYSKLSRKKNLVKTIEFLSKQQFILLKNATKSSSDLNKFAIDNGLGDIGLIPLDNKIKQVPIFNPNKQKNDLLGMNIEKAATTFTPDSDLLTSQRFNKQFQLLELYESQYLDYSSRLKPNSVFLKELKLRIDNLKESLKRPNEILLKFRELSRKAQRDEIILNQVQDDLAFTKLEKARQKDPWEMIFEPTIEDSRVYPKRTNITIFSFLGAFSFGIILSFFRERISGKIYELDDLRKLINCELIESLEIKNEVISNKIIDNFIERNSFKNEKNVSSNMKFINTFNDNKRERLDYTNALFESRAESLFNFRENIEINESEYLIFFLNQNTIYKKDIDLINQFIGLYPHNVLGWFYIKEN